MDRGFIALWRQAGLEDMQLDPHTHKLWILLQLIARFQAGPKVKPGDVKTSYGELQDYLRETSPKEDEDGKTYSRHTLQKCIDRLVALNYLTVKSAKTGVGLTISINHWDKMQGKKPKGYSYHRYDYPGQVEDETGLH